MIEKNILQIKHVSKSFGGVIAVDDVSFELREGEVLGIIGPNGSGKTTLVNLITSFEKKDAGEVLFKGKDITKYPAHKIADMETLETGMQWQ
jgi:ABC-type branched-subunit amino acid transport system ATPase component